MFTNRIPKLVISHSFETQKLILGLFPCSVEKGDEKGGEYRIIPRFGNQNDFARIRVQKEAGLETRYLIFIGTQLKI